MLHLENNAHFQKYMAYVCGVERTRKWWEIEKEREGKRSKKTTSKTKSTGTKIKDEKRRKRRAGDGFGYNTECWMLQLPIHAVYVKLISIRIVCMQHLR